MSFPTFEPEKNGEKNKVCFWAVLITTPVINTAQTFRLVVYCLNQQNIFWTGVLRPRNSDQSWPYLFFTPVPPTLVPLSCSQLSLRDCSLLREGVSFAESAKTTTTRISKNHHRLLTFPESLIQICLSWHAYETFGGSWTARVLCLPWASFIHCSEISQHSLSCSHFIVLSSCFLSLS